MFKKATIKSFLRITSATLAFIILFATSVQSYSLAAEIDHQTITQEISEDVTSNNSDEPVIVEPQEEKPENLLPEEIIQEQDTEVTPADENFHEVNLEDIEVQSEEELVTTQVVFAAPWVGMGIGQLLGWLAGGTAAAVVVYKFAEDAVEVRQFARELSRSREREKPKYFLAYKDSMNLYVGKPLTESEAVNSLNMSSRLEIWTANYSDAQYIAKKIGKSSGHENHYYSGWNDTRYFDHVHGERGGYRTGHIFFGTNGRWGLNRPGIR